MRATSRNRLWSSMSCRASVGVFETLAAREGPLGGREGVAAPCVGFAAGAGALAVEDDPPMTKRRRPRSDEGLTSAKRDGRRCEEDV